MVAATFEEEEGLAVLDIPLPSMWVENRRFWWPTKTGWCCRNKAIFDKANEIKRVMVVASFVRLCEDYCDYNARVGGGVSTPITFSRASWVPPHRKFVMVNVDAYVSRLGGVCLGAVFKDEWGKLMLAVTRKITCR
uniref:Uncharacterized protein n=1 Tax=Chenopodium quinoa TaxID=63459 RepID=A0A803LW32_CHEQI